MSYPKDEVLMQGLRVGVLLAVLSSLAWIHTRPVSAQDVSAGSAAKVPERAASSPEVRFSGGLLSVTAKQMDVRELVRIIAEKSGVGIDLEEGITGNVSVDFKDLEFEDGLKKVLHDVLGGGFVGEYVRKPGAKHGFDLEKVVIARRATLPAWVKNVEEKDVLRIDEMYVGEAKGEEVLFVPWGDGEGQIPLKVVMVDGQEVRLGFARFRVGEDGTFYFVGWGHKKLWVYSSEGKFRKAIDLTIAKFGGDTFDVTTKATSTF